MQEKETPRQIVRLNLPKAHCKKQQLIMSAFRIPGLREIYVACGSKFGKMLSLKTIIPTVNGFKTMGDIIIGDIVFDEHGKPTKVISMTEPIFGRPCYEILFSDGNNVIADAEHEWFTKTHNCRKNMARVSSDNDRCKSTTYKPEKITTEQILETLMFNHSGIDRPNHSIDLVSGPVEFNKQNLIIPPYTLGVWLGNGKSLSSEISNPDMEILKNVESDGFEISVYNDKRCQDRLSKWTVIGLQTELKKIGVYNNKHIPYQYLVGDQFQRLALLQGLMDTYGIISESGNCTFNNTNKNIADGVQILAQSLGVKCTRTKRIGMLYGVEKKLCYSVHFTTDIKVFRLGYKRDRLRTISEKSKRRYIVSVIPVESVPMKCITVDSDSHLYLCTKAFIPTHNSIAASVCQTDAVISKYGAVHRWIAPYYKQALVGMDYFKVMLPPKPYSEFNKSGMVAYIKDNKSRIEFWHTTDPKSLEGAGIQSAVFDEAAKSPYEAYISHRSTTTFTKAPTLFVSTPFGKNWFYRKCMEAKDEQQWALKSGKQPERIFIQAKTEDNPYIPKEVIEKARRELSDRAFRQLFLAEFLDDGNVFAGFRNCFEGEQLDLYGDFQSWFHDDAEKLEVCIGADWAKHKDYTVFFAMTYGEKKPRVVGYMRFKDYAYPSAVNELVKFSDRFKKVGLVYHDCTGIGTVISDLMARTKLNFEDVCFTNASKSQMVNELLLAFESNGIIIPWIPDLEKELDVFEVTIGKTVFHYSAPLGHHDDTVCALMLVNSCVNEYTGNTKIRFLEDLPRENLTIERYYNDLIDDDNNDDNIVSEILGVRL